MLAKRKSEPLQQYSRVVGINVAHGSFRSTSTQTTMGATFLNQQGGTPSLLSVGAEAPTDNRAGVPPCWRQSASGKFRQSETYPEFCYLRFGATKLFSRPTTATPTLLHGGSPRPNNRATAGKILEEAPKPRAGHTLRPLGPFSSFLIL